MAKCNSTEIAWCWLKSDNIITAIIYRWSVNKNNYASGAEITPSPINCVQLKLIWPIVFMITWIVSKQQLLFWRNKCSYQLQDGVILAMATAKAAEYSGALTEFQFSKMIAESRWTTHISRLKTQRRMTYEEHMPNLIADIIIRFF